MIGGTEASRTKIQFKISALTKLSFAHVILTSLNNQEKDYVCKCTSVLNVRFLALKVGSLGVDNTLPKNTMSRSQPPGSMHSHHLVCYFVKIIFSTDEG